MSGLYFRQMVRYYLILLVGRVGSSYLTSMLNTHPEIKTFGEKSVEFKDNAGSEQLEISNKILTAPIIGRYRVIGFNAKLVHIKDREGFAQLLQQKKCKIIHMQRRNTVKSVISHLNGRRLEQVTGNWGLYKESDRLPPFKVDPYEFDQLLQHREDRENELRQYVSNLKLPVLSLYYEDLITTPGDFILNVLKYLNVRIIPLTGNSLKNTSDDLSKVIINFEELRSRYAGTPYAEMFDEVLTPMAT